MITLTARFDTEEVVYTADRDQRTIRSGADTDVDHVVVLAGEALESDRFIGPQVDEWVGAWGSWDADVNVIAALMDAVAACGGHVAEWTVTYER